MTVIKQPEGVDSLPPPSGSWGQTQVMRKEANSQAEIYFLLEMTILKMKRKWNVLTILACVGVTEFIHPGL